jgi:rhamnogalacturonyl hydrolase YesR
MTPLALFTILALASAAQPLVASVSVEPSHTGRFVPISEDAFAGSSVNVVAGLQHTLFTSGDLQYAAFYAGDGTLALAKRRLGSDEWEVRRTEHRGRVANAHNTVSLAIDGAGYLHVAWDHHNNRLNYARSVAPGSLELGPKQPMTGQREDRVTYPAFMRLPDGDLLFFYRDGSSGRGNLVLNRYATSASLWSQVHGSLIDGEGERSAYPAITVDGSGTVHLAWVWRRTPDVATNHHIAYARSKDGGLTWTSTSGAPLALPITAAGAEYAVRIPENSSLMNGPTLAVDRDGHPAIANYWKPAGSDIPQYHIVRHNGSIWRVRQVTNRTTPFTLAGASTKRPPLSRSALFLQAQGRSVQALLVFRDDEQGGRIVLARNRDMDNEASAWSFDPLTANSVGAWEPAPDLVQWNRLRQIQMLAQVVEQRDGNDRDPAPVPPSTIGVLAWSPFSASQAERRRSDPAMPSEPAAGLDQPLSAATALSAMERAADWQLAQNYQRDHRGWEIAPFYIGLAEIAPLTSSPRFEEALLKRFNQQDWQPARRVYHADDHAVIQAYALLHRRHGEPRMLEPAQRRFEHILSHQPTTPLDWGSPRSQDRWSWCDALFMAPPAWLDLYHATGDQRYLDFMNREWWLTTDTLYHPQDRLYARDESFLDLRESNGRRIYWSRGNGWVVGGLVRVLERFPASHPDFPRYEQLYREMMQVALATQQPDGLWRSGLLDPDAYPARETSGSAFFTYALAWGVNRGLVDRSVGEPAVRRAWNALAACVNPDGRLEHVQPIGTAPGRFDPRHSDAFAVGAFLLAGSEVIKLADAQPPASSQ